MVKQICDLKRFGEVFVCVARQVMIQNNFKTTKGSATVSSFWEAGNLPLEMFKKLSNWDIEDIFRDAISICTKCSKDITN